MNYFIYNNRENTYSVIFDFGNDPGLETLNNEIREFYSNNLKTNSIICLVPSFSKRPDKEIKSNISGFDSIKIIRYHADGFYSGETAGIDIEDLKKEGMNYIFKTNNGLLQSDASFHYVLPSGKHSSYFIRVGNILNNQSEVYFISFCLLKYLTECKSKLIYYDTSSILTILLSLVNLYNLFTEKPVQYELKRFSSYEGLYETEFIGGSLVIISASNSGNLQNRILRIEPNLEIVTVIFNSVKEEGINFLLNVRSENDITSDTQYQSSHLCKFCEKNSIPVNIAGEHFLPLSNSKQEILISKGDLRDLMRWLHPVMKELAYCDTIACYGDSGKRNEVYFDLTSDKFLEKLTLAGEDNHITNNYKRIINTLIPASTSIIFHLDDEASKQIATKISQDINGRLNSPVILTEWDRNADFKEHLDKCTTAIIVASTVASGNKLIDINKSLRDYDSLSLIYFVGVLRTTDKIYSKRLFDNLTKREHGHASNSLYRLIEVFVPDRSNKFNVDLFKSPWQVELDFLEKKKLEYPEYEQLIESRVSELQNNYLFDSLFYPSYCCKSSSGCVRNPLELKMNYAFFRFEEHCDGEKFYSPNQSEVYFTITSILHNLRNRHMDDSISDNPKKKGLIQHEHMKSLLSPVNFQRFNDGVIQASILRASRPAELNYLIDLNLSNQMLRILKDIFLSESSSDVSLEFLYAIASGKLRLSEIDTRNFINDIKELQVYDDDFAKFFVQIIEDKLNNVSREPKSQKEVDITLLSQQSDN